MNRRTVWCLLVIVAACGSDGPPNVGDTCTATAGCDDSLTCDTTIPGGYCTTGCLTLGATTECPADAICDSVAGTTLTCVRICKSSADCRVDQDCNGVSSANIKACKPKP